MHIKRYHHQLEGSSGQTLEEFYLDLGQRYPRYTNSSNAMITLLQSLQALPDSRQFIALTSHSSLCFVPDDSPNAFWWYLVKVAANDKHEYHISCRIPDRIAPWNEARVEGVADSVDQAISMILKAIDYSEGWSTQN